MNTFRRNLGAVCVAVVLAVAFRAWGQDAEDIETPPGITAIDFREIIDRAKSEVFPALVYVKPIVEEYEAGERRMRQVFGSGVIITPNGLVVTNNHVVDKAVKVNCVLHDKEQVPATIKGCDLETDLALLQLEVPEDRLPLPYGVLGESEGLSEGDFVMALGSPFGFTRSISLGILSNTRRYLGFETEHQYNLWLQTDAAINPGNSGGPLVDTDGRIVGINTLGIFLSDNIGFAIPVDVVKRVVEDLREHGQVQRAWVGLRLQPLKDFFTNTFTDAPAGVLIADVEPDSPAEAGGIEKGDILLRVGDTAIEGTYAENLPHIACILADLEIDKEHVFTVLRHEKKIPCAVTPVAKGKVEGETFDCRRWNMTVKEINRHEDPTVYFYAQEGVYVYSVRWPGNAEDAGLRKHDILTAVDRKPVSSLEDLERIYTEVVGNEEREKKVLVEVMRNGYKKWFNLEYAKDYDKE